MKRPYIIIPALAAASLCLWQCAFEEAKPLNLTAPEINFITTDEVISAKVGEQVTIETETLAGDRLTKSWYVGDVLVGASDKFTYTFETPGTYTVKYVVFNGAGRSEKSYTVNVSDVLEIHLSVGDSLVITRKELTNLQLYAIVDKGSDVTHSWTVDGEKVCDEAYFILSLPKPNVTHTVVYEGKNSGGDFTKTFDVDVEEQFLEINFQDNSGIQPYFEDNGSELKFTMDAAYYIKLEANVIYGYTGAAHKWSVDGKQVSDTDKLIWPLLEEGTHTVDYVGTNAKGEKIEKSWSIVYDENAEGYADGNFSDLFQLHNAKASLLAKESLAVIDSPYDDDHGRVLCWHIDSDSDKTRGGILLLNEYFAGNGIDLSQFKGIKFSGRLRADALSETARRCPCVAYQTDYSKDYTSVKTIRLGKADGGLEADMTWNYVCKPIWVTLEYDVDFSEEGTIKIFPTCWSTKDRTASVTGKYVYIYIDDIVFFR